MAGLSETNTLDSSTQEKGAGDFAHFPEITPKTIEILKKQNIEALFPVQYKTFDQIYNREDLIVRDLTGSGKTLGFSIPVIEYLRTNKLFRTGKTQALILAPTRELAVQITKVITSLRHDYREFEVLSVYGGVSIN